MTGYMQAHRDTCVMCVVTYLMRLGVELCVGLLCLIRLFIVTAFGLVSSGPHCFLHLSSAVLITVLIPWRCWDYSSFSV